MGVDQGPAARQAWVGRGVVARIGNWCPRFGGIGRHPCSDPDPTMPFKANAGRRHHISNQERKVTNWSAYDASLRQRGNLTVWFTDEAIAAWQAAPRTTRGGQPLVFGAGDPEGADAEGGVSACPAP